MNMMNNPWQNMHNHTRRRIDKNSKYDIFWAMDLDGKYSFCIELPNNISISKKNIQFIGLNTFVVNNQKSIIFFITLSNNADWQLFKFICDDIVLTLENCNDPQDTIKIIKKRLLKWKKLFIENIENEFGLEKQMGLFGELNFLKEIAKQIGFKNAVSAWVGSESDKQDFLFNNCVVEIKTYKTTKSPKITISSAEQLYSNKKQFYLASYALSENSYGKTIDDIIKLIEANITDSNAFYRKLFLCGYKTNLKEKIYKFKIDKISYYDVNDKFPKIITPNIDARISGVKYTIELLKCNEFLIDNILV